MSSDFHPQIGIYAFRHPITQRVMYVGQSIDTDYRVRTHNRAYRHSRLSEWIMELKRAGLEPKTEVLEAFESTLPLHDAEKKWIYFYKVKGEAELNISVGGSTRAPSKILNSSRDDWWQLASKVRDARALLKEINEDALHISSTKHDKTLRDIVVKFERVVEAMEREMIARFPEWKDISAEIRSAIGRGI